MEMNIKRLSATLAAMALLLGSTAGPALADRGGNGHGQGAFGFRVSEKFDDMGEYAWGLGDVTKMQVKGIFKGQSDHLFAPGAKISHQEAAVAIVRLIDKESLSTGLTADEITTLLKDMSDAAKIATWARPAVAELVKLGIVDGTKPFGPTSEATRLDVAVLLVKALGLQAEAATRANTELQFRDAQQIPADLVGYVAVAVEHKLITGYDDRTFRPNQGVKRVEMAVMMGRADNLIDRHRQDEVHGTIKSVDVQAETVTVTGADSHDVTLALSDDVSIFVDNHEKSLADLTAGMTVMIKLNDDGKAEYIEAKTVAPEGTVVTGTISALTAPTSTSLGLITVGGHIYPVSATAAVTINSATGAFADLKVGDSVTLTHNAGVVIKIAVVRTETTVTGTVTALTAPQGSTAGQITVNTAQYPVPAAAVVTVNTISAVFADVRVGDSAVVTISAAGQVTKVAVTRAETAVNGTVASLVLPTASAQGVITVGTTQYPVWARAVITLNGNAAAFADLLPGDTVGLTIAGGQAIKVAATRATTVREGSIIGLVAAVPANGSTPAAPAQIQFSYMDNNAPVLATYTVQTSTQILVSSATAQFADLRLGDAAKITLTGSALTKVEVTR